MSSHIREKGWNVFSRRRDVRIETLCSYLNTLRPPLCTLPPLMNRRSCCYPDECKPARFVLRAAVDCASIANIISSIPSLWDALLCFGAVMPRSWMWGYSTHYWWHFTVSHRQTTGFPEGICIRKNVSGWFATPGSGSRTERRKWNAAAGKKKKKISHLTLCNACHTVVQKSLVVMNLRLA